MNAMYSNRDGQLRSNSFGRFIVNGNVNETWLCRFSPTPGKINHYVNFKRVKSLRALREMATWKIVDHAHVHCLQMLLWTDPGEQQDLRRIDSAARNNYFPRGTRYAKLAVLRIVN